MQVKKSSRILTIFINGREYAEKILVCTEISQFMNILELNVEHLETLMIYFLSQSGKKMIKRLLIC